MEAEIAQIKRICELTVAYITQMQFQIACLFPAHVGTEAYGLVHDVAETVVSPAHVGLERTCSVSVP